MGVGLIGKHRQLQFDLLAAMSFKIDTSEVKQLVNFTGKFEDAIARAEFRAVNKVAEKANTRSRREITTRVNLSATYVRDRMTLTKAILGRPTATIVGRGRATTLTSYGAKQLTSAAPKSRGSAALGIPAGRKAAGISVGVDPRKGRRTMNGAFFVRFENGYKGVFSRQANDNGKGNWGGIWHKVGPSVDQTFSLVIRDIRDDVSADLEDTMAKQLDYELKGL